MSDNVLNGSKTVEELLLRRFNESRRGRLLFSEQRILRANSTLVAETGYGHEELRGMELSSLLEPVPDESGTFPLNLILKDGTRLPISCRTSFENGLGIMIFESEAWIGSQAMAARLESILELTRKMSISHNPREIISDIADACCRLVNANTTTVFALNAVGDTLIPIFTDDEEWGDDLMEFQFPVGTGLPGHVVQTGVPTIINDPLDSDVVVQVPGTPDEADEVLMSFPLRSGDRVLGAITTTRPIDQPFTDSDLEIISILAGQVSGILATAELLDKLAESELKFRSLVNNADVGLFRLGLEGELSWVNPHIRKLLHLPANKDPEVRDIWGSDKNHQRFLELIRRDGMVSEYTCRTMSVDGRLLEFMLSGRLFRELGYIEGVLRDITERRRLEMESRNRLSFLENLISQIPLALVVLDPDGLVRQCNKAFEKLFETSARNLLVEQGENALVPRLLKTVEALTALWRGCLRGQAGHEEEILLPASLYENGGEERYASVTVFPVHNKIGNLTDIVLMLEDVTRRRTLQRQVIRAQKMESIGALSGGIAHDFNNILGGILGNASFLRNKLAEDSDSLRYLEVIERGIDQASQLTRQLLGFSRQGPQQLNPVDVNSVIEQTLELFRRTLDQGVELQQELDPGLPAAFADSLQFEQVVLNLLLNANEALNGHGRIAIRSRPRVVDEEESRQVPDLRPGNYVEIEVRDTGRGIPPELHNRIFDPFFTTKRDGEGSGLGLSMVYSILRAHGGHVELASRPDLGTRFRLLFPAADEPAREAGGPPVKTLRGTEHVLVVDDEAVIRDMLTRILESLDYSVTTFDSGLGAIEYYRERHEGVDLVILDVVMPDMNGLEVYEEMRAIDPGARILICSGYTQNQRSEILDLPGISGFIEKPFTINTLSNTLRRILDADSA